MRLDYVVSRIEASQEVLPYVYVTYANQNDYKAGADRAPPFNRFGANMMAFTSLFPLFLGSVIHSSAVTIIISPN
jgi:hypothetical protein